MDCLHEASQQLLAFGTP